MYKIYIVEDDKGISDGIISCLGNWGMEGRVVTDFMKVMAEDKVYFRKMRVRILRKMAAIKRVDAPKEAVAWRLSELSSRYKDNKRYLRDIAKGEEILMKQMTSTMGV